MNYYGNNDYRNYLAHYGRKGMRRGKHLPGTTWWKYADGVVSGRVPGAIAARNIDQVYQQRTVNRINSLKQQAIQNARVENVSAKVNSSIEKTDKKKAAAEDKVVQDTINGKYGNGEARRKNLEKAGYSYEHIQNKVNESLGSSKRYEEPKTSTQKQNSVTKTANQQSSTKVSEIKPKKSATSFVGNVFSNGLKALRSIGGKTIRSGERFVFGMFRKKRKRSNMGRNRYRGVQA